MGIQNLTVHLFFFSANRTMCVSSGWTAAQSLAYKFQTVFLFVVNDLSACLTDARKSVKKAQNTNLHKLVLINKAPLSKSLSMPDMENRIKKRERLLAYVFYLYSVLLVVVIFFPS